MNLNSIYVLFSLDSIGLNYPGNYRNYGVPAKQRNGGTEIPGEGPDKNGGFPRGWSSSTHSATRGPWRRRMASFPRGSTAPDAFVS